MNADVHALAGAFALDALPPEEAAAFIAHLAECAACQQEVAELQVTATHLGLTAAQAPPAGLRDRVLAAAHDTRQVPPVTEPGSPGAAGSQGALTARRRVWPRLLVAAAVVLVAIGAGVLAVGPTLDRGGTGQDQVSAVMKAPDAHSARGDLTGGGSMTVVASHRMGEAVVLSERLPPLDSGDVYQLWLVDRGGQARSAGVLIEASRPGRGHTSLVRGMRPGDRVAITREPAGGSNQPTTRPLAMV